MLLLSFEAVAGCVTVGNGSATAQHATVESAMAAARSDMFSAFAMTVGLHAVCCTSAEDPLL